MIENNLSMKFLYKGLPVTVNFTRDEIPKAIEFLLLVSRDLKLKSPNYPEMYPWTQRKVGTWLDIVTSVVKDQPNSFTGSEICSLLKSHPPKLLVYNDITVTNALIQLCKNGVLTRSGSGITAEYEKVTGIPKEEESQTPLVKETETFQWESRKLRFWESVVELAVMEMNPRFNQQEFLELIRNHLPFDKSFQKNAITRALGRLSDRKLLVKSGRSPNYRYTRLSPINPEDEA